MLFLKKILTKRTPYKSMAEITKEDWKNLDHALQMHEKHILNIDLYKSEVFAFILQEIKKDRKAFIETPRFIYNNFTFQHIAALVNPKLKNMLFPGRRSEVLTHMEMELNKDGTYKLSYEYDRGDGIKVSHTEDRVGVDCMFEVLYGEEISFPIIENYAVLEEEI